MNAGLRYNNAENWAKFFRKNWLTIIISFFLSLSIVHFLEYLFTIFFKLDTGVAIYDILQSFFIALIQLFFFVKILYWCLKVKKFYRHK